MHLQKNIEASDEWMDISKHKESNKAELTSGDGLRSYN